MKQTALKLVPPQSVPRVRRSPTKKTSKPFSELGVIDQIRIAFRAENRLAAFAGFLLGGFVPLATYCVAHLEYVRASSWYEQIATPLVLGGLSYSAKTVYDWGKLAFAVPLKALGFVVLLEGVMTFSSTGWLGIAALGYLMIINGIATATRLTEGSNRG